MNPDAPKTPREEMEAWLTSLLLGELSEGEAAAVRELMKHDPELARLHDRLKQSIALLREAEPKTGVNPAPAEPLKLSEERRQRLLTAFKIPPLKPADRKPRARLQLRAVELLAVVLVVSLLAALLLPALSKSKRRSYKMVELLALPGESAASPDSAPPMEPQPARRQVSGAIDPGRVVGYVNVATGTINGAGAAAPQQTVTFGDSASANYGVTFGGGALLTPPPATPPPAPVATPPPVAVTTLAAAVPAAPIVLPRVEAATLEKPIAPTVVVAAAPAAFAVPVQSAVVLAPKSPDAHLYYDASAAAAAPADASIAAGAKTESEGERLRERFAVALKGVSKLEDGRKSGGVAGGAWYAGNLGITATNSWSATMSGSPVLSTNYVAAFDSAVADNFAYGVYAITNAIPAGIAGSARGFYNDGSLVAGQKGVAVDALARVPEESLLKDGISVPGAAPAVPVEPATGLPPAVSLDDVAPGGGIYLGRGVAATTPPRTDSFGFEVAGRRALTEVNGDQPVLGDVPILGKLFRGTSVSGSPSGTIVTNGRAWGATGYSEPNQFVPASPALAAKDAMRVPIEAKAPAPYYRAKPSAGGGVVTFGTAAAPATNNLQQTERASKRLRASLALSDADAAGSAPAPSLYAEDFRRITAAAKEGEVRLSALRANVQKLKTLSPEQLAQVLPQLRSDPRLAELSSELTTTEQELARAKEGKSPASSARLQTQVAELKRRLAQESGAALSAMDFEATRLEHEVAGLKKTLVDSQADDIAKATASRPYYDKKRELEELQGFARILYTKLSAEGIDLKLKQGGGTPSVEIMDRAMPAKEKTGFWRSLGAPVGGSYASSARVKVERDVTDIEGMAGARSGSQYDPYFIQNEFETIQSEAVLGKVVELLDLNEKWAKQAGKSGKLKTSDAVGLLKSKLSLAPVRNTSFVELKVRSENSDEAARIANAIADVYLNHRAAERLSHTTSGIKALEERYREQQEKIKKAARELEQLRASLAINDTDAQGMTPAPMAKVELDIPVPRKPSTNAPIPQPEIQTGENNFSTFSLNVSDVSFKLAMASLEKGQMPDAASVRSEEFINAFDYRDPEPAAGAPIAFAWERARYPFAHNRDLLRFSLKTAAAGRVNGRPLNIVLLLDNSGSMERADRVQIIRQALHVLAEQLQPQDKLSVITFARTPRLVADGISGDKAGEVTEAVAGITPQGGTNLEEAMNLAYATALKHYLAGGINRVVLLTDGAANLGDVEPESLKNKVETHRRQGIALDAFGIGWEGYNDDLLEVLSRNGDGRYGFINSPEEAATEFAGQLAGALKVAASDVKVQVEFNPRRVTSHRQIVYAKHQLTKEQFRDNTVDAAEIAAQEAGNALYTVEVNPAGDGPLCTVRVRYKIPGTTDYREQAWDVPYTGNALSLEQSSPAMRLAASASAFAEWLVASPFAGEVTPDRVLGVLSGVPEVFGADARPKKLEWMIRQAKSIEGK